MVLQVFSLHSSEEEVVTKNFEAFYLCDFVFKDIKTDKNLESSRKINFNLVSEFLSKRNF